MSMPARDLIAPAEHHSAIDIDEFLDSQGDQQQAAKLQDSHMNPERRQLAGALIILAMLLYLLIMACYVLLVQFQVEAAVLSTLNWLVVTVFLPAVALALLCLIRWLSAAEDGGDTERVDNITSVVYIVGDLCLCVLGLVVLCYVMRRPLLRAGPFMAPDRSRSEYAHFDR